LLIVLKGFHMFKSFTSAFAAFTALTSLAVASDLPSRKTEPAAPSYSHVTANSSLPAAFAWDGYYVGGHLGYGTASVDGSDAAGDTYSLGPKGFVLGAQAGYNYVFWNNYLAGLELDADYTGFKNSDTIAPLYTKTASFTDNYRASLVGRIGYIIDDFLLYGLGGATYHNAKVDYSAAFGGATSASPQSLGWTLGLGGEYAIAQNWTARLEYRYSDFGSSNNIKDHDQTITLGVNYKFDSSAPLSARY
jgi:outer membrane immunogenic protein